MYLVMFFVWVYDGVGGRMGGRMGVTTYTDLQFKNFAGGQVFVVL